jgi:tRNA threonylcarbamoyladenosine biosynthesis protein TsaB
MSRVLALDTSTETCTLALWSGGAVRARHEQQARAHNRHILRMLSEVLDGQSLAEAVDMVACGIGPGSFTGLRVAVSVAQGLAWSRQLPVHGFCSLSAQVYSAAEQGLLNDGERILTTIDARIDQLYGLWGEWRDGVFTPDGEPFICPPEAMPESAQGGLQQMLGSGAVYRDRLPAAITEHAQIHPAVTPDAAVMARLLGTAVLQANLQLAHTLSPQYVQKEIGWKKLSEQGRRD